MKKFTRKNKTIDGKTYKYVNEAKRESRRLQLENDGALGRGTVRVIK